MRRARVPKRPSGFPAVLSIAIAVLAVSIYIVREEIPSGRKVFIDGTLHTWQPKVLPWVLALGAIAYFLRMSHRARIQEHCNQIADVLLESPSAAPFWLYLRPFILDGAMPQSNPSYRGLLGIFSFDRKIRDFEELLREAVQKKGKLSLVGLGVRANLTGAGRPEKTDSTWQEHFESLARFAGWIVVIPSGGAVCWEVEFLQSHHMLEKTLFLMPPVSRRLPSLWPALGKLSERKRAQDLWNQATEEMQDLGLGLPAFRKCGMFFTLDGKGEPARQAVLASGKPKVMRRALKWLSDDPLV